MRETGMWLVAVLVVSVACGAPEQVPEEIFGGATMGTTYAVKVVAPEMGEGKRQAVRVAIERELELVNSRMSTWLPDSELSLFNAWTEDGPFTVSTPTLTVFREALAVSAATAGAFDITVAPLVEAWGFGPSSPADEPPSEEQLTSLRERVGWEMLELDEELGAVRKSDPRLTCDLSAIAKGYAVDRVAEALEEMGFERYMVEVGGEVRVSGRSGRGELWRIGIERPESGSRGLQRVLSVSDVAIATSGDYRNFVVRDGRRRSHTIDPRTGRPVQHAGASVSVVTGSCMRADAWATALMVLGPDEGLDLAVEQSLAAFFLVHDGEGGFGELATPEFDRIMAVPAESESE